MLYLKCLLLLFFVLLIYCIILYAALRVTRKKSCCTLITTWYQHDAYFDWSFANTYYFFITIFYQQQQWDLQLRRGCPIANVVPWHIVSVSHHQWWFIINNNFSFLSHLIIVVSLKKTWRRDKSPSRSKSWWFVMVSKLWNFWLGIFSLIIFCFVL